MLADVGLTLVAACGPHKEGVTADISGPPETRASAGFPKGAPVVVTLHMRHVVEISWQVFNGTHHFKHPPVYCEGRLRHECRGAVYPAWPDDEGVASRVQNDCSLDASA